MRKFAILSLLLLVSACNTAVEKAYQKVTIKTPGVNAVDCAMHTEKNQYRALSQETIVVERSSDPLVVTCKKVHYFDQTVRIEPKIKAWYSALNVVNGVVPGTAWDVATNSIYSYPDVISIEMVPDLESMQAKTDAMQEQPYETRKKQVEQDFEPVATTPRGEQAFDNALKK